MITCLLLSAGLSQRFGSPKALAKLNGETVIGHLQKTLLKTQIDEIIVVLGAYADDIKPHLLKHKKLKFVYNKDYNLGQTSSFKTGLANISAQSKGFMLLPVDHPFIKQDTFNILIRYFLENAPRIIIPTYNERKGHPPLFSADLKDEFLALDNETGLNVIAHAHQTETRLFAVEDAGVVESFNTQEEFERLRQQL